MVGAANVAFWSIFTVSFTFTMLKSWGDKYNNEAKLNGGIIYAILVEASRTLVGTKAGRLSDTIASGERAYASLDQIYNPILQLQAIMEQIQGTVSEIFGVPKNDVGASVIYDLYDGFGWRIVKTPNGDGEMRLDEVVANPGTTFSKLISDGNTGLIFYPNKKKAKAAGCYVDGPKDSIYDGVGSILCQRVKAGSPDSFVDAVVTITTYGRQICRSDDSQAQEKIKTIITPIFMQRISLELSYKYISNRMTYKE